MIEKTNHTIRFGTKEPVRFRETLGTDAFDADMSARTNGTIRVSAYDTEKYENNEKLTESVRAGINEMIEGCLKKMSEKSVMRSDPRERLAAEMVKALTEAGIEAEVEIAGFTLDDESQQLLNDMKKEIKKQLLNDMIVDRTDRPYIKPDCAPMMPSPGIGMMMYMQKRDKFCRECGNKLEIGDKFCRSCGAKVQGPQMTTPLMMNANATPQKNPPSDKGLKMLIDCCRKVLATAVGDGHDETVLYLDESNGQYQIHTYSKTPGCPEYHRAFMTDENTYLSVMDKIRENDLINLEGSGFNGMCGGEYVVKFVIEDMVTRVSTASVPYEAMSKLYEIGALLNSFIDKEKEIG